MNSDSSIVPYKIYLIGGIVKVVAGTVRYGTCASASAYFVEAYVTCAPFTDLAGKVHILKYSKRIYFVIFILMIVICRLMEPM